MILYGQWPILKTFTIVDFTIVMTLACIIKLEMIIIDDPSLS